MGMLDDALGSSSNPAIPGGDLSKPLIVALLALLAARYTSGGPKEIPSSAGDNTATAASNSETSPGEILGGLGGLFKQFQQNGFGDVVNSWIGTGPNDSLAPDQISKALGPQVVEKLSQRTGLSTDQITQILSQVLPGMVNQLTPQGRLPTQNEIAGR